MNILAFFAHPDDETMLAGGTLALLAQSGDQVHYLCATRGEGGEVGEPPVCSVDDLGECREEEMVCAVHALSGRSLTFLDYIDPRVGPEEQLFPYTDNLVFLAGQVAATLRQFEADVLLTHGSNGEYGHPAHQLSHQAARLAIESFGNDAPLLYTVAAYFEQHPKPRLANKDDPAHLIVDVKAALSIKTEAALCHRSQHALFVRRTSQEAGRVVTVPEVVMSVESLHRASPVVSGPVEDQLAERLRPWLVGAAL
ncbi:MAG: PIG-L deacetylase family protein [Anaerolineales bacterium]